MPAPRDTITTAALLDVLTGLLEAEQGSVFRFMRHGSPYLTRATVDTRRQIEAIADANQRHAAQLAGLITRLGGLIGPRPVQPADQYLAYLSLKFLLPKLANAKRETIERYENAVRALKGAPPEARALLEAHLAEHRAQRETLLSASRETVAPA
jgi:hypothetical protein